MPEYFDTDAFTVYERRTYSSEWKITHAATFAQTVEPIFELGERFSADTLVKCSCGWVDKQNTEPLAQKSWFTHCASRLKSNN